MPALPEPLDRQGSMRVLVDWGRREGSGARVKDLRDGAQAPVDVGREVQDDVGAAPHEAVPGLVAGARQEDKLSADAALREEVPGQAAEVQNDAVRGLVNVVERRLPELGSR
eukprot:15437443-Alexandrium_andersonii.AAC.1